MPKLHEIVAVLTGKKTDTLATTSELYKQIQKEPLFDGLTRTYQAAEDGGEELPGESKHAQLDLRDLVREAAASWGALFDLTLALDVGNQVARADVVVDGQTVVANVPTTTLLFLEKRLTDIQSFISKLPTPDPAERWVRDETTGQLVTAPVRTARTKKVQRPLVLYHATPEHPAQAQVITEDVLAGYWTTVKSTTRLPAPEKAAMLSRVAKLRDAVKEARERANTVEAERPKMARAVLGYVFGPLGDGTGPTPATA